MVGFDYSTYEASDDNFDAQILIAPIKSILLK